MVPLILALALPLVVMDEIFLRTLNGKIFLEKFY